MKRIRSVGSWRGGLPPRLTWNPVVDRDLDGIDTIVKTVTTRNDASVGVRTTGKPNMSTIDLHNRNNENDKET